MEKLETEIKSMEEMLDNAEAVKGPKFVSFCKFVMNCSTMTNCALFIADGNTGVREFFLLTTGSLIKSHAHALGLSNDDVKEALSMAKTIQDRLENVKDDQDGQDS